MLQKKWPIDWRTSLNYIKRWTVPKGNQWGKYDCYIQRSSLTIHQTGTGTGQRLHQVSLNQTRTMIDLFTEMKVRFLPDLYYQKMILFFIFDLSSNPTFPEDIIVDRSTGSKRSDRGVNRGSQQVHILTQKEIDMAQRARNLLDAENEKDKESLIHSKSSSSTFHKKGKKKSKDKVLESDDSDDSSRILTKKQKKNYDWSTQAESGPNLEVSYTPGAIRFAHAKRGYATGISDAVKGFNRTVRPADFPKNLSKELLEGEYIDLRRIKGEFMANKKGYVAPLTLDSRDRKLSLQNKVLSEKLLEAQEWFYYFDILQRTYQEAFPSCYQDFLKYSIFIKEQFMSDGRQANWKCVAEYDAALRRNFAEKENISFGDFDHPSLSTLSTQYMYKAYKPPVPEASTSARTYQSSG
ncbi:hypothetical protein DFH28DRAFT_925527 [Melampsora americana]|nr:hypothetical protein DFH28DRAFT_925527 [Melampsora americana]